MELTITKDVQKLCGYPLVYKLVFFLILHEKGKLIKAIPHRWAILSLEDMGYSMKTYMPGTRHPHVS